MPCDDIAEVVVLRFDDGDRLTSYSLTKRTCGAEIGHASLLLDLFESHTPSELVAMSARDVVEYVGTIPESEAFLYFKHLVAVQEATRVYTGESKGSVDAECTVVSVGAYDGGTRFEGLVGIQALSEKIRACGNCGACGART